MLEKLKDNYFRVIYIIICLIIGVCCYLLQSYIVNSTNHMIMFSYYASAATVIALIISIMEIFYNIRITKSIKSRSLFNLTKFKDATGLSYAHECVTYYNQCLGDLATKKYTLLVANFTIAKKLHIGLANYFMAEEDKEEFNNKKSMLNGLEKKIISTRYASASNPLGNAQIKEIQDALLDVKQGFESKYTFKKSED